MTRIEDVARWYEAYLDTPWRTGGSASPEAAMRMPGCCVKSKQLESPGVFPREFGLLVEFTDVRVLVRSHDDREPRCIWTGTQSEYFSMWECD